MSSFGITNNLLGLIQSSQSASKQNATPGLTTAGEEFSSSLALQMASFQAQSVSSLIGSVFGSSQSSSPFDFLTGTGSTATSVQPAIPGLSASGRNLSLFDPESGYRMMSVINNKDVSYKAQFAELSEMKTAVAGLQQAGQSLAGIEDGASNDSIKTQLQAFTEKYNAWIKRFDGTVQNGGLLDGTQAAEISLYELEQSIESIFNGAKNGFHGLSDLGLTIDQSVNLATLDGSKLDAVLANNKSGVVGTVQEFAANFARSAELLNSPNNFIPNRLSNLDRVIDYIADHKTSLQAEFGRGDPATPSPTVSKALAAYQAMTTL